MTKGTDCTEAFETFHVFGVSNTVLQKFWVKKANSPRRYRYTVHTRDISEECFHTGLFRFTFEKNGFYKTLQRKAAKVLKEVGTGPDWFSAVTQDFLFGSFLLCFLLLCYAPSYQNALLAGW